MNLNQLYQQIPGAQRLVPIDNPTVDEIMALREMPGSACSCPGCVDGWHTVTLGLGPFVFVRHEKCGGCDENGLAPYVCLN